MHERDLSRNELSDEYLFVIGKLLQHSEDFARTQVRPPGAAHRFAGNQAGHAWQFLISLKQHAKLLERLQHEFKMSLRRRFHRDE